MKYEEDPRIGRITDMLLRYAVGDFSVREEVSEEGDAIDAIIVGLNTLGEEIKASGTLIRNYEERINAIMQALLKYTLLDFSEKAPVTDADDDLDAIALGLNTLAEELAAKIEEEKERNAELQKLATIVETTADAVTTISPEGTFTSWNKSAEHIYGYTAGEMIGRTPFGEFTREEYRDAMRQAVREASHGKQVSDFHTKRTRKDGEVIDVSITFTPIFDNGGKVVSVSGISRDITAHKKAEDALRQSEEKLRLLIEGVKDYAMFLLDPDGYVSSWNKGAENVKGYKADEIIGKHYSVFYRDEEVRRNVPEYNLKKAVEEGRFQTEGWRQRKDGSVFWADIVFTALYDEQGKLRGFAKVTRDITQRRQAEEQIKESRDQVETILENAPNAVIVMDEAGKVVRWNSKSEAVFGWRSEEIVNKQMHKMIMPPRYIEAHTKGMDRFMKTGEGPVLNKTIEVFAVDKTRREFPIELSISATRSRGKHLFIAFINDITERKRTERKMNELNEELSEKLTQLEIANQELEAFTYSVSHDLRAPLRAIHGYTRILTDKYESQPDQDARSMMDSVAMNAKKMGQLIDDLLAFSRLGRKDIQKDMVNMTQVAESALAEIAKTMNTQKAKIIIQALPEAWADKNLITQVFINLLSNSVKYSSQEEKPVIEIGAIGNKDEMVYYVMDNGVGFNMEYYGKLFGVFQRLHDASEFEGTGVGLAIVKRIIDKHGGKIWAESQTGKGAAFYFSLKNKPV